MYSFYLVYAFSVLQIFAYPKVMKISFFFPGDFIALAFILRFMIHFELIFVYNLR